MTDIASTGPTTSLAQRCQELRTKVTHLASLEKDAELLSQLTDVEDALDEHIATTKAASHVLGILSCQKLLQRDSIPAADRIATFHKIIETLQKKLMNSRSKLKSGNEWAKCDKEAGALSRDMKERLMLVWRGFVTDHIRNTDGFQAFRHIDNCSPLLQKLDGLGKRLSELTRELPTSEADLVAVRAASAEMDALIAEIDLGDVPIPVQDFLRSAAQGGVPLASLTDEVLLYLRKRKFAESLRVTSGTSSIGRL
jgi:DNA repair exonuclease SbcCD ATPase subunit